jgi:hypothetical protein
MAESITRRSALMSLSCLSLAGVGLAASEEMGPSVDVSKKGPPFEPQMVKQFVGAAHGKLDEVKATLADFPGLVNATWDWGGGDFESALGGASHMGRADIAEYLLEHGARIDLFAAAMLGKLEIIKAAYAVPPDLFRTLGPHGITLVAHAEKGGERSLEVLKYLQEVLPGC